MPDGCPMPDTCMPVTANCPAAACPAVCNFATDMTCPGGVDASGCMLPDTCMPQTGINTITYKSSLTQKKWHKKTDAMFSIY